MYHHDTWIYRSESAPYAASRFKACDSIFNYDAPLAHTAENILGETQITMLLTISKNLKPPHKYIRPTSNTGKVMLPSSSASWHNYYVENFLETLTHLSIFCIGLVTGVAFKIFFDRKRSKRSPITTEQRKPERFSVDGISESEIYKSMKRWKFKAQSQVV